MKDWDKIDQTGHNGLHFGCKILLFTCSTLKCNVFSVLFKQNLVVFFGYLIKYSFHLFLSTFVNIAKRNLHKDNQLLINFRPMRDFMNEWYSYAFLPPVALTTFFLLAPSSNVILNYTIHSFIQVQLCKCALFDQNDTHFKGTVYTIRI